MAAANTQFAVAVHILAALGSCPKGSCSSDYLAGSVNATPSFVRRILALLVQAGLVHTVRGPAGGCRLARPSEQITLLDVYRAVDPPEVFALHQYPQQERCTISCRMKSVMTELRDEAQAQMERCLATQTMGQLLERLSCESKQP